MLCVFNKCLLNCAQLNGHRAEACTISPGKQEEVQGRHSEGERVQFSSSNNTTYGREN